MSSVPLWKEILFGWILLTIVPKLLVIPVYRWLWQAMKASDRQDLLDAAWLASIDGEGGQPVGGRGHAGRARPRRPRPAGPHGPARVRARERVRT